MGEPSNIKGYSNDRNFDEICQRVTDTVRNSLSDMKPEIIKYIFDKVMEEVDLSYSLRIQRLEEHMAYLERSFEHTNSF